MVYPGDPVNSESKPSPLDRPVPASDHTLAEHLASCLDAERCQWSEYGCPCTMWRLGIQLCAILMTHAGQRGDNEGAVATLQRIIRERDSRFEHVKAATVTFGSALRDMFASLAKPAPVDVTPMQKKPYVAPAVVPDADDRIWDAVEAEPPKS